MFTWRVQKKQKVMKNAQVNLHGVLGGCGGKEADYLLEGAQHLRREDFWCGHLLQT